MLYHDIQIIWKIFQKTPKQNKQRNKNPNKQATNQPTKRKKISKQNPRICLLRANRYGGMGPSQQRYRSSEDVGCISGIIMKRGAQSTWQDRTVEPGDIRTYITISKEW